MTTQQFIYADNATAKPTDFQVIQTDRFGFVELDDRTAVDGAAIERAFNGHIGHTALIEYHAGFGFRVLCTECDQVLIEV